MALGRNPLLDKTNQSQSRVGSGFTNLQRVLDANKQNRLGQTITTGVGNLAQQNKQAVGQAQGQFQTDAEKGRLDIQSNTQFRNQALQNARSGSVSDQDVERFNTLQVGQYAGPQNLANVEALKGQAEQVQQLGTYGSDANKSKGLLQKFVGSPRYSLGQKTLDSTIIGQDPNIARGIRQQTVGVARGVDRASNAAQAQALELGNRAKGYNEETRGLLSQEATGYDAEMTKRAAEGTVARTALIEKAKQQLQNLNSTGSLSKDVASGLGLTEGQRYLEGITNPIYGDKADGYAPGRGMADYFQYKPLEANKQSIQSQEDYNKIQALKRLGGSNANADAQNAFNQYMDSQQVGQFKAAKLADFDKNAYEDDAKRFDAYVSGDLYNRNVKGLQDLVEDTENNMFSSRGNYTQTLGDILNRKASQFVNNTKQDTLAKLALEARGISSQEIYREGTPEAVARKKLTQQLKQDLLNRPGVQEAIKNGTMQDLLDAAHGTKGYKNFRVEGDIVNREAVTRSIDENIGSLADRSAVIKKLQDWSAAKKLKLTD